MRLQQIILILLLASVSATGQGIMLAGRAAAEEPATIPTSGLIGWYDASDMDADGSTDSGSTAPSTWVSKGNSETLSITGSPQIALDGNGNRHVYFNASEGYTGTNTTQWQFLHEAGSSTYFVVVNKTISINLSNIFSTMSPSTGDIGVYLAAENRNGLEGVYHVVNKAVAGDNVFRYVEANYIPTGSFHYLSFQVTIDTGTSHAVTVRRNGTTLTGLNFLEVFSPGSGPSTSGLQIGYDATFPMIGYIGEVIIYNRALDSTEINQVEAYLANKYGL